MISETMLRDLSSNYVRLELVESLETTRNKRVSLEGPIKDVMQALSESGKTVALLQATIFQLDFM